MQALGLGFRNYFRFTGRSSRGAFWWWWVWMVLYTFVAVSIVLMFEVQLLGGLMQEAREQGVPVTVTETDAGATTTAQQATTTQTTSAQSAGAGSTDAAQQQSTQTAQPDEAPQGESAALLLIPIAFWIGALLTGIPSLAVHIRRLHDAGLSGWLMLLMFVPLGVVVLLILAMLKPTPGPNKHGPVAEAGLD